MISFDAFNEFMDIGGCYVLVNSTDKEVVYYEVVMEDNKFMPTETHGVWKFVFACGGHNGFASYVRTKIDVATVKQDIQEKYASYKVYDHFEIGNHARFQNTPNAFTGLQMLHKSLLKMQLTYKLDHGEFVPVVRHAKA